MVEKGKKRRRKIHYKREKFFFLYYNYFFIFTRFSLVFHFWLDFLLKIAAELLEDLLYINKNTSTYVSCFIEEGPFRLEYISPSITHEK